MLVTLEIPPQTRALIERHAAASQGADLALRDALAAALSLGADGVSEGLQTGVLDIRPGKGGLAQSVQWWWLDPAIPMGAVGVPSNSPAAPYATIQEFGGTIQPKTAKALAVPISAEARGYSSPRDMTGLELVPRKGRPPLLVRMLAGKGKAGRTFVPHWVLLSSVTLPARHWLAEGMQLARDAMERGFLARLKEYIKKWTS